MSGSADDIEDDTQGRPHGDRIVSHGHDRRAAETGALPEGFDASESGVADAVPTVPDGGPVDERPGDTADTRAEVSRERGDSAGNGE